MQSFVERNLCSLHFVVTNLAVYLVRGLLYRSVLPYKVMPGCLKAPIDHFKVPLSTSKGSTPFLDSGC